MFDEEFYNDYKNYYKKLCFRNKKIFSSSLCGANIRKKETL